MYHNNNNNDNKSTIFSFLKIRPSWVSDVQNSGFYWLRVLNGCRLFILRTFGVCLFVLHQTKSGFSGSTFSSVSSFVDWSIQEKIFKQVSAIYQSVNLYARQSILLFPSAVLPQFRFLVETRACTICSFEVFIDYFFQFYFFSAVCDFPKNKKKLALVFDKNNQITVNRKTFSGKVKLLASVASYRRLFTHSNYFRRKKVALD